MTPDVEKLRYEHTYHPVPIEQKCPALANVLNAVSANTFGGDGVYEPLLNTVRQGDYYILTDDFDSYIRALEMVDEAYADTPEWTKKSIRTVGKMGFFSSDRAIQDYAQEYWVRVFTLIRTAHQLTHHLPCAQNIESTSTP